jgi:predicted nucleic acid-binding protein
VDVAVVDTGPLIAATDQTDPMHEACARLLRRLDILMVVPALCIAEATHLIARDMGSEVEAQFLRGLRELDVRGPESTDWERVADLVLQYSNLRLGGTDASVIALAERLDARIVITLDHRHFATVRPRHCERFQLLPEL